MISLQVETATRKRNIYRLRANACSPFTSPLDLLIAANNPEQSLQAMFAPPITKLLLRSSISFLLQMSTCIFVLAIPVRMFTLCHPSTAPIKFTFFDVSGFKYGQKAMPMLVLTFRSSGSKPSRPCVRELRLPAAAQACISTN